MITVTLGKAQLQVRKIARNQSQTNGDASSRIDKS